MSRIYHNEPLSAIPVHTHHVDFVFDQKFSGKGVLLEGTIVKRTRHIVIDTRQNKERFFVLHVQVNKSHRRKYDPEGKETEPNFSETGKIRQGYLHSSYKTASKGETDQLSPDLTMSVVSVPTIQKVIQSHCPPGGSTLALWISEGQLDKIELDNGDNIRIKTKADCPFIESLAKLDVQSSSVSNYAGGEAVGGSWTDKVMAVKGATQQSLPQDMVEGVDDDEWED